MLNIDKQHSRRIQPATDNIDRFRLTDEEAVVYGQNLDEADEWLRQWTARTSARAEAAQQMSERIAALTSTATAARGTVKVTVSGSGALTGLELPDRVHRIPGQVLAATILDTMRRAQGGLAAKVIQIVQDTVGTDSETGAAVIRSFKIRYPAPEPPP